MTNAVVNTRNIGNNERPWKYDQLLRWKTSFEDAGLELTVIEGTTPITDTTRLGKPGRDEEIDKFIKLIRNLGRLDIPILSYNWMTSLWWTRTSIGRRSRGGSLVTAYDNEYMQRGPPVCKSITEEDLWKNLEYFLERVVPVAEDANVKLGLHPDDPPLSPIRGVPRIIRSPDAYDRVMNLYPSDANGITFCQGNFAAMNTDIPTMIQHFKNDIQYVHFRDVRGSREQFEETWHDNGPTDMAKAMQTYQNIDFDGPMRPDHVPTMVGESNDNPGYETKGRLFAIGYMKGLIEQGM